MSAETFVSWRLPWLRTCKAPSRSSRRLPTHLQAVYAGHRALQLRDMAIASVATLYCLWLLYAAGPKYMLLSALLYAPGSLIYLVTMKTRQGQPLSGPETGLLIIIWVAAAFAGWMLWSGTLAL